MRRSQKWLLGIFAAGVLLGGVGTGVAMVEYSGLSYGGRQILGVENLVTENLDFSLEQGEKKLRLASTYWLEECNAVVQEDDSVPEGIVRYEVSYNPETVNVSLRYEEYQENEECQGILYFSGSSRISRNDGFAFMMEQKDEILSDLKQKRISSYSIAQVTDVVIKVNSETAPYIEWK